MKTVITNCFLLCLLVIWTPGTAFCEETAVPTGITDLEAHGQVINDYCVRCHNDKALTGGLSLDGFDVTHATNQKVTAEKIIRKLRTGMMPPPRSRRPDDETIRTLAAFLETNIDNAAAEAPNPGSRPFQRLNRAEYARAVKDLLGLDVDVSAFLPADTISHGFDNIADVQSVSPTLMQGYLRAADSISHLALGDPAATASETTYKVPRTASQREHVKYAPIGTRGGLSVVHTFPADGEYVFKITLHSTPTGQLFGSTADQEQLEISIEGERVSLLEIDSQMSEADPRGMTLTTEPISVRAGSRRLSAAFLELFSGPIDDLVSPIEHTLADTQIGIAVGLTTFPHLRDLAVSGPYNRTGVSETSSRTRVFTCRPTSAEEELPCAEKILTGLASKAYRRPLTAADLEGLMTFYQAGAKRGESGVGNFESGIRLALQAMLTSPHFVLRVERPPTEDDRTAPGTNSFRLADLDLAARMSYFLWGTGPDEELIELASQGVLSHDAELESQVHRMLEDPRSEALASRFASQWLRLQDLDKIHPDALLYSSFDQTLAQAMRQETELFFNHLVRENRSFLELLDANYTFLNQRLANHYGVPNITGSHFRRVELNDENRQGLLGHGSVLTLTSHANRTSAVLRGKWIMEVLLGSPPPPPPPDVPDLEATEAVSGDRILTVRERMEEHRSNPSCNSCHRVIDPLGLSLENFDVTGAWRTKDQGQPVDPTGRLFDGTELSSPSDLRAALLKRPEALVTTFAENLLAFGVGRRVGYDDMPAVRAIVKKAAEDDYRIRSFLLGVVKSPAFLYRSVSDDMETGAKSTPGR